ncbi:3-oxoacyl-ACP synthase III family protein [Paenibacillus agri]|uniref:Ketoacyl-ACP synthase III n=1 Tax=Paenibacillus agri TaxID=2744309 RepID=A0A850EJ49_9BACL|nr:ketoacyl-ACP synthase III [Paenibacillus agri]NUU60938.1 ketoacyl-ACP synthase III [Paenibacillus agri]
MKRAIVKAIEYYVPEKYEENSTEDSITGKIGILQRPITGVDEFASDLAIFAVNKLFDNNSTLQKSAVDMLIYCTQSPDYILPTTACVLQDALDLPRNCAAFDVNLGCSGYVYGLSIAKAFIESGIANNILLITSDTYSKYINENDRSVKVLFGDGASATLVSWVDSEHELIGPFIFGTDGGGKDSLIIKAGGLKEPISNESGIEELDAYGNLRSRKNLYMNGSAIFNFALKEIPTAIGDLLKLSGTILEEYDRFVFHQANKYMNESLRRRLKIPEEKFSLNIELFGNTVSSSIPIAICEDIKNNKIIGNNKLMLVGFGVGYSWAACNLIINL